MLQACIAVLQSAARRAWWRRAALIASLDEKARSTSGLLHLTVHDDLHVFQRSVEAQISDRRHPTSTKSGRSASQATLAVFTLGSRSSWMRLKPYSRVSRWCYWCKGAAPGGPRTQPRCGLDAGIEETQKCTSG